MSHAFDDIAIIPSLKQQLLNQSGSVPVDSKAGVYFSAPEIDLDSYDKIILCASGGKDSLASLLHLFDMGVNRTKIELWHHDVDGREGSDLMDWHFMADYNRKIADTFGLPLYFSWLVGGFEGEMLKNNSFSHPHKIETPGGILTLDRDAKRAQKGTRLKFPQLSASLQTRWCSSALKIDVGRRAINNQPRFDGQKVLFITGERRDESSNRSRYNQLEPHACDRRYGRKMRTVDAWRPVLHWSEEMVSDALERHKIIAPVPYRLGWNRSSCMTCIYNSPRIWATISRFFPERAIKIANYENDFGNTISRKRINVLDISNGVTPMNITDLEALEQAVKTQYDLPVIQTTEKWILPAGAFGKDGCGSD